MMIGSGWEGTSLLTGSSGLAGTLKAGPGDGEAAVSTVVAPFTVPGAKVGVSSTADVVAGAVAGGAITSGSRLKVIVFFCGKTQPVADGAGFFGAAASGSS